jgi:hypothetical protein
MSAKKGSLYWLSIGTICLLVGGTIAAKSVLLVDEDIEITTKFSGKSWQLNSQSLRKYATDLDRLTHQYIDPVGTQLGQQSNQLITKTGDALAERKDWCIPKVQFSSITAKTKDFNPFASDSPTVDKNSGAKPSKDKVSQPFSRSNNNKSTQPQADRSSQDWCITTGTKK